MARRQLTYTDLRVALFVLLTVVLLIVGIFYVTGQGAFESTYTIKTYLPEAEGLVPGAPVSLGGVRIGSVTGLSINPNAANPDQNIEIDMNIYKNYQKWIRENSTATLITQGALGTRYVTISRGTPPAAVLENGESVQGLPASTIQTLVNHSTVLLDNLNGVTVDLRAIADQIHSGKGTLGKLLYDSHLYSQLNQSISHANDIMARLQSGQGTAGKLIASDALYDQANSAIGRVDELLAAVRSQKGSLGKMIYDPALYNNANGFLSRGNSFLTNVQAGKGSLGKLATDSALYNNLSSASANLRDLTGKLNHGQGTMGEFFTNPQLYSNLTGLTGDLRVLLGDFQHHPKKYLRIKMSLF
ncbi:MAG TPA: MlaD family protein [Candidatus Dormibacteraeota bacterium]|nr:MlaD family protein [Candidatus Dormibacteraeota bacterium]